MEQYEEHFGADSPNTEPGMNLISVDYDIIMVNRPNERLYAKSMVALLGNKCYREFEKREGPCPHCPGRLALATGEAQETETTGLRDDGTRFAARIKAHPVIGPDNRPTGFIEIVEDITEQKRAESLSSVDGQLQAWLAGIQNVRSALREALRAALLVEGIDCGAAFMLQGRHGETELVVERGLNPTSLVMFTEIARRTAVRGAPAAPPVDLYGAARPAGSPRVVTVVPVLHRGEPLAVLIVGSTVYPEIPTSLRNGLQVLGATTGTAISRILAEQSRGDAIADLEAVISVSPLPTWAVDAQGSITMWNRAAEKVFGWRSGEVVGNPPPWQGDSGGGDNGVGRGAAARSDTASADVGADSADAVLAKKDGSPVEVRLSAARFRDVVGNDSARIYIAEDLRGQKRIAQLEARVAQLEALLSEHSPVPAATDEPARAPEEMRVLIIDGGEDWGEELAATLTSLAFSPVRCLTPAQSLELLAAAGDAGWPFCAVIVALVGPGGESGLEQRGLLRSLGLEAPVILCSDVEVRGHEQHGIAAVITRPCDKEAVREALLRAIRETERPRRTPK